MIADLLDQLESEARARSHSLDRAVRTKLPDLERQRANVGATHGALFCRRRGGTWVVVMTPEMWFALIRETL